MRRYEQLKKITLPIWPIFDTQCQIWANQGFELAVPATRATFLRPVEIQTRIFVEFDSALQKLKSEDRHL